MNTIRNLFPDEIEELKVVLRTVYARIHRYQELRTDGNERTMRDAILAVMPYLLLFKEHIPAYKQRYIELLENQEQLVPYDLIICFDRAVYELHARVKAGEFAGLPWSKELRNLLNERQEVGGAGAAAGNVEDGEADGAADESNGPVFAASGTGVSHGTAEGPACLVFDRDDLSKIKAGDILVTPMTDPGFIEAAHLLAGLVTDRGGLICHAAILAREFGLPCIVGCRDATRQIKDGDRLQLDARTGIVMRVAE